MTETSKENEMSEQTDAAPIDVAVGRALRDAIAEHMMGTETCGGVYEMGHGMFGAYHWCACGWRSDDGPWRDPAEYVSGMAQSKIDHLANAMNAVVREHLDRDQAEVARLTSALKDVRHVLTHPEASEEQKASAARGALVAALGRDWLYAEATS